MGGNGLHPLTVLQEVFGDPGSEPLNCQEQDRQEPADKTIDWFIYCTWKYVGYFQIPFGIDSHRVSQQ